LARRARPGAAGGGSGQRHQVEHAVERAERNIVWELAHDLWRPVRHPHFRPVDARGRPRPDPRHGEPAHRADVPRLSRQRQAELAEEYGYRPTSHRGREPIFENPDGDPRFISYDRDGHGSGVRGADGKFIPYDGRTPEYAPNVPWKGANNARTLVNGDRDATYVPKYDADGNVRFDPVRD